jgi:hypothetical protein
MTHANELVGAELEEVPSGPLPFEALVAGDPWVLYLPDDNPPAALAFDLLGAFGPVDLADGRWTIRYPTGRRPSRETVYHEELHRRLHYRFETLATAPHLECWRHRDPVHHMSAASPTHGH